MFWISLEINSFLIAIELPMQSRLPIALATLFAVDAIAVAASNSNKIL